MAFHDEQQEPIAVSQPSEAHVAQVSTPMSACHQQQQQPSDPQQQHIQQAPHPEAHSQEQVKWSEDSFGCSQDCCLGCFCPCIQIHRNWDAAGFSSGSLIYVIISLVGGLTSWVLLGCILIFLAVGFQRTALAALMYPEQRKVAGADSGRMIYAICWGCFLATDAKHVEKFKKQSQLAQRPIRAV